jgi:DNA-binding NtrC family response regulator
MNHRVLIIDDDEAFRELLKGVFEQAGYSVFLAEDGETGYALLESEGVNLVVLDQRLPGGETGRGFLQRLHQLEYDIPVIIVSGYLNDDAIRDFIREGASGIFLKPLNIFSLLKRANALLSGMAQAEEVQHAVAPAMELCGIRGQSRAGQEFLAKAAEFANFRRNLLLIGPEGMPLEDIAQELNAFAETPRKAVVLRPSQIVPEAIARQLSPDGGPYTVIISEAERLSAAEVDRLVDLADARSGAGGDMRLMILLGQSVEALYDAGTIDEVFYMFLGTNELHVPALRDMPEDMIDRVKRAFQAASLEGRLDARLRGWFSKQEWPRNIHQFDAVLSQAIQLASPHTPTVKHLESALAGPAETFDLNTLRGFLGREKVRYLDACEQFQIS